MIEKINEKEYRKTETQPDLVQVKTLTILLAEKGFVESLITGLNQSLITQQSKLAAIEAEIIEVKALGIK